MLIAQTLRLPGQEFDFETGIDHNGFRDTNLCVRPGALLYALESVVGHLIRIRPS